MRKLFLIIILPLVLITSILAAQVNLAKGKEYFSKYEADPKYPDDGTKLTDGRYGYPDYKDTAWIGTTRKDQIVVVDLKDLYQIDKVSINFLRSNDEAVFLPSRVDVAISEDGIKWQSISSITLDNKKMPPGKIITYKHSVEKISKKARFVAFKSISTVWLFMDEIEVLGDSSSKSKAPKGIYVDEIELDLIDFES